MREVLIAVYRKKPALLFLVKGVVRAEIMNYPVGHSAFLIESSHSEKSEYSVVRGDGCGVRVPAVGLDSVSEAAVVVLKFHDSMNYLLTSSVSEIIVEKRFFKRSCISFYKFFGF